MRRTLTFFALLLTALATCQESARMVIQISGAPVGENVFTRSADGSFSSESKMQLGAIKMSSTVSGHLAKGLLIDAKADSEAPTGHSTVTYENGKVSVVAGGKTSSAAWKDTTGALAGNLHPQLFASSLILAERQIKANPALKSISLPAYFVDAGVVLPLKITVLQPKSVTVAGKTLKARAFSVEVSGLRIELALDDKNGVVAEEVPVQHLRFVREGWESIFADPIAKFPELSQATYKVKIDRAVHMKTRDGVDLVCDVIRPDDDAKHPAILVRTPYGRASEAPGGNFYATRGYAYVVQDCRGREDSGGVWDPFVHEGPDGYDTIQWVAGQPWCDGKVGMIGGSYAGYVQWAAAVLHPPALKCIVPQVSPPDAMRNIPYDHGVFGLYLNLWWAKIVADRHTDFSSIKGVLPHPEKLVTLPLSKVDDAVLGQDLKFFDQWLTRSTLKSWKGWDFTEHLDQAKVPALHISGIWDGDEIGTHINWNRMRELGRTDQWIIFGPWVHAFNTTRSIGKVEYGDSAIIDLDSIFLRWFDTWLKGKSVRLEKMAHVKLFVTGANKWIDLDGWPSKSTPAQTLYLAPGSLTSRPGPSNSKSYVYDPAKDVKIPDSYLGKASGSDETLVKPSDLKGALVFKSQPFTKKTAISSPFSLNLYFRSSAVNTDFFAMIIDIAPNGEMRLLGQPGKIRASYLAGMDKIQPLVPGRTYRAEITPWDFAHEFGKGHRMALVILSSMFPTFSRNLGTVDPIATATRMVKQNNTILMGKGHLSSLKFYRLWEH